jgi:photosystem II stability/assembly factor-like uncharacterized protein
MKILKLTFILLLPVYNLFAQTFDVKLISPQVTASVIRNACFADDLTGWLATDGHIYSTYDGGISWQDYNFGPVYITDISSAGKSVVFCTGYEQYSDSRTIKVFKSSDGGKTWVPVFTPDTGPYEMPLKLKFSSRFNGYLLTSGYLFKTTDGGESWTSLPNSKYLQDIDFFNDEIAFGVSRFVLETTFPEPGKPPVLRQKSGIFVSKNGGATWEPGTSCTIDYDELESVQAIDAHTAMAAGSAVTASRGSDRGSLIITTDTGKTWCTDGAPLLHKFIGDFLNIGRDTSFVVTTNTELLYTFDRWKTTKTFSLRQTSDPIYSSSPWKITRGARSLFITGDKGFIAKIPDYRTPENFTRINGGLKPALNHVTVAGCNISAGISTAENFISSGDCGISWKILEHENNINPYSVRFSDNHNGYLLNYYGFYQTSDGGTSWQKSTDFDNSVIGSTGNIYAYGSDYIVRTNASIFVSNNSGKIWDKIYEDASLREIYSYNKQLIFLFPEDRTGSIRRSADFGKNWETISLGLSNIEVHSIQFIDQNTGFLGATYYKPIGENSVRPTGILLKTTDGGNTWTQLKIFPDMYTGVTKVHFLSENIGYLSSNSDLYKTTDGGNTWAVNLLGTPVLDLSSYKDSILYISGDYGLLASTEIPADIVTENENKIITEADFIVFPNPASGTLKISGNLPVGNLNLLKTDGTIVKSVSTDSNQLTIDLEGIEKGMYFIQIKGENWSGTKKVIVD